MSASHPTILKVGYLTKEGEIRKSWKNRWCTLDSNGEFKYHKSAEARKCIKHFNVIGITIQVCLFEEKKRIACWKMDTPNRVWFFASLSEKSMYEWLATFSKLGATVVCKRDCQKNIKQTNNEQLLLNSNFKPPIIIKNYA